MTASATIGYTSREIRRTRTVRDGDEQRTIRVQQGRGNARRAAIRDSLAGAR